MKMDAQGGRPAGLPAVLVRPVVRSSGWWRASSLAAPAQTGRPAGATATTSPFQSSQSRLAGTAAVRYLRGEAGVKRSVAASRPERPAAGEPPSLSRAPLPAASTTRWGDCRHSLPRVPASLLANSARYRRAGYRRSPGGKERDFSFLSVLIALFLGLLLVAAGLYGIFLGMSQHEAIPALAPVGSGVDETISVEGVTTPSTAWNDRLRGLVGPGLRLAARELWTSALATALPGLMRVGPEPETVASEDPGPRQQIQSPPGGRSVWGWLTALTGVDVRSPTSMLSHTLPGFRTAGGGPAGHASLLTADLPARGGKSAGSPVRDSATAGAGGEWPVAEVFPSSSSLFPGSAAAGQEPAPVFMAAPSADLAMPADRVPDSSSSSSQASSARNGGVTGGTSAADVTGSDQPRPGTASESGPRGDGSGEPLVLIYHTHTAESYHARGRQAEKDHYEWNSTNSGVIQVGNEIAAALRAAGIPTVHSVKVNDYPVFSRSYSNSRQLVRDYLRRYPSIVVALDIHRDGKEYTPDSVRSDGQAIARVAFVVGTNTTALANPHWRKNLAFAQQLHQALQELHPGVSRGIMLREDARFNEDLLPNLLVVEVGTYTNELAEAKAAGRLLGRALAEIMHRP